MSYMLPHLHNGWQVDQAILAEEDRVVVIRFGHDWDPSCMRMDEAKNFLFKIKMTKNRFCANFWGLLFPIQFKKNFSYVLVMMIPKKWLFWEIYSFLNEPSRDNFMRGIDCAHSRSVKTLP
jgi:hypothetical protein